jgi:hypothetical protein
MKIKNIARLTILLPALVACEDAFEPMLERKDDFNSFMITGEASQGLMMNGYDNLPHVMLVWPTNPMAPDYKQQVQSSMSDVATDDAVTNDIENGFYKLANGGWTAKDGDNPFDRWMEARRNIYYINMYLSTSGSYYYTDNKLTNDMFNDMLTGEAYALRGLQMFYFLRTYAGLSNGILLGVPNLTKPELPTDNFNVSRATFAECVQQIFSDFNEACERLPYDYGDITAAQIPQKFRDMGVDDAGLYNLVYGNEKVGRISGRIIDAIAAQVALFAASPAYSEQSGVDWEEAAIRAAKVLDNNNGVAGLAPKGNTWYCNNEEIALAKGNSNPPELIWRKKYNHDADIEGELYPVSMGGKQRVNPTQNLVDAFPMANGYPITDANSNYDPQNPYANRDPRLDLYIGRDGAVYGPYNWVLNTTADEFNNDGLDISTTTPNRTGYIVRKHVNEKAEPDRNKGNPLANGMAGKDHMRARIRYTEIYLAFAEAANEAYGPATASPSGYSAYDVIKAIRQRGGIVDDPYLESIKSDKDKMRELIRNERRIELCFEGHRFWDLRRWKANLNEPLKAMRITSEGGKKVYTVIDVANEVRDFKDYMYYGPLPESEIIKWSNLLQNDGWY